MSNKQYLAAFKVKVVLEVLREEKELARPWTLIMRTERGKLPWDG